MSSIQNTSDPILEPATRQFVDDTGDTFLCLPPADARAAFSRLQSSPVGKPNVVVEETACPLEGHDNVRLRIIRPASAFRNATAETAEALPAVIYCHGGGWIAGDAGTHDRLIRQIAVGARSAVVFVCYDRAPEAQFPAAIEQAYAAASYIFSNGAALNIDPARLAIAGDCAGGTIAAAVTLLARERHGPKFNLQIMLYPVMNADFETDSYRRFAEGPWLKRQAMRQVWDHWLPDAARRTDPVAAPVLAPLDSLAQLPDALIIVAEVDPTRDDAEWYARKLSDAGVRVTSVRYNGTIHDFAVLNTLADTPAARSAVLQINAALLDAFG
ncbi:MAG TPA: alpha/beta hydrolase [Acetobacteraceae bacterium]|nr:alpha/beta hydrolase [Acetobacteraceae bacterium]